MRKLLLFLALACLSCPATAKAQALCAFGTKTYRSGANSSGPWIDLSVPCNGMSQTTCRCKIVSTRWEWSYDYGVYVPITQEENFETIHCGNSLQFWFSSSWFDFPANWPYGVTLDFYQWNGTSYTYVNSGSKYGVTPP